MNTNFKKFVISNSRVEVFSLNAIFCIIPQLLILYYGALSFIGGSFFMLF